MKRSIPPLSYEIRRQVKPGYVPPDIFEYLNKGSTDILLIICPAWDYKMPPIGLAYLSSYLKHNGLNPKILDLNIKFYNQAKEFYKRLWRTTNVRCWMEEDSFNNIFREFKDQLDIYIKKIISANIRLIGFSILRSNLRFTIEVAKQIRSLDKDIKIIFGGHSCSIEGERETIPEGLVDAFVIGEGEETLCDIVTTAKKGGRLTGIPNTLVWENGKYFKSIERPLISDLDTIPYPTYSEFNLQEYYSSTIPLLGSRGCLRRCSFCDERYWKKFRTRSAEHIFSEIKYHYKNYKVKDFKFNDLACNFDLDNLERLCELIINSGYDISWLSDAVVRKDMPFELFKKMKKSGCYVLRWGIESGSNRILKKMRKGFTIDEAEEFLEMSYKAGIINFVNIIVGFPGETEEDFLQTIEFLRKNERFIDVIPILDVCHVTPGSDLECNPDKYDIILPRENCWSTWFGLDGNTCTLRKERLFQMISAIHDLDIDFNEEFATNLHQDYKEKWVQKFREFNQDQGYKSGLRIKTTDVFLVMLPPWGVRNPPIGLAYLVTYLKYKGINAEVLDLNIKVYNRVARHQRVLWDPRNLDRWRLENEFHNLCSQELGKFIDFCVKSLLFVDSNVLGFSVNRANLRFTIEVVQKLKSFRPDLFIIFGGHSCSIEGERKIVPEDLVNLFVIGEGEETLREVLEGIKAGVDLEEIPGALVPGSNRFTPRELIRDLDSIPYPTYEEFDLNEYDSNFINLPILSSRGCPRRCVICNDIVVWKYKFRHRKAQHIFEEIKHHVEKYNVKNFEFTDSACNGNLKELELLTELLINSKYEIRWIANMMVRRDINFQLLKKMKDSGCEVLRYGIESGSDEILNKMNKGFSSSDAEDILKMSHNVGIKNYINLIVGFPGESEVEFNETVNFLKNNKQFITGISNVFPCFLTPGSKLELDYKNYGITLPNNNYALNWYDEKGNTYSLRKGRVEKLATIICELGIELDYSGVWALEEGKVSDDKDEPVKMIEVQSNQEDTSIIQFLKDVMDIRVSKSILTKTSNFFFRFSILFFIGLITFAISLYIWILKKIKGIIIFPGS